MAIIRYRPSSLIQSLQDDINQLFSKNWLSGSLEDSFGQWAPQVDVKEEDDKFIVTADIPGVEPKDIEISMDNNVLSIKAERKIERDVKEENYTRSERFSGTFYRQLTLPDSVDSDKIQAQSKHGVLALVVPKKELRVSKRIEVQE